MKKLLLVLVCLFIASAVHAKGSLQFKPYVATYDNKIHFSGGLNIYEDMGKWLHFTSWTGAGEGKADQGGTWATSKMGLDFYFFEKLILKPGVQFNYFSVKNSFDTYIFVQADYRLW